MAEIVNRKTTKKNILKKLDQVKENKLDIDKYFGKLKTDIDPIEYQRQLRDEW